MGIDTLPTLNTMNDSGSVSASVTAQVSAIVPARNEEEVIAACIRSLAAQYEGFCDGAFGENGIGIGKE